MSCCGSCGGASCVVVSALLKRFSTSGRLVTSVTYMGVVMSVVVARPASPFLSSRRILSTIMCLCCLLYTSDAADDM
eukprot:9854904-Prorocentrum_lima.AAC.1